MRYKREGFASDRSICFSEKLYSYCRISVPFIVFFSCIYRSDRHISNTLNSIICGYFEGFALLRTKPFRNCQVFYSVWVHSPKLKLSSLKLSFADFNSTTIWYLWLITLCGFPLYIISLNSLHAHRHLGKSERHDWNHQTLCILAIYLIITIECWTLYWTGNSNKWFIIPAKNERLKDQSIVLYWRKEVLPFMENRFVRIEKYTQIQNFVNTKNKNDKNTNR